MYSGPKAQHPNNTTNHELRCVPLECVALDEKGGATVHNKQCKGQRGKVGVT